VTHRFGIEDETWFEAARTGLERRGFKLRLQPRSIVIDKEGRLPRIVGSAREFLEFAERQGLPSLPGAMEAADKYGDGKSDTSGRVTPSPFETPLGGFTQTPDGFAGGTGGEFSAGLFAGGGAAQDRADHATQQASAVESRLNEIRLDQDRLAAERRAAQIVLQDKRHLEQQLTALQHEMARLRATLSEAAKQRDMYQMAASAAEEKLRLLQAEQDTPGTPRGADKRFDQLRRFLARELHPDLSGEDAAERALRENIFKRVWAKIEQIQ
jgi:hypothetical protein